MDEDEQLILHYPFRGLQRLIVPFGEPVPEEDDGKGRVNKLQPLRSRLFGHGLELAHIGVLQLQRQPLLCLVE